LRPPSALFSSARQASSFFEKKEAKKLFFHCLGGLPCASVFDGEARQRRLQTDEVFLLLFVHKKKILFFWEQAG
jgi:hypothetical protein